MMQEEEDDYENALEIVQRRNHVVQEYQPRGDSFDVGHVSEQGLQPYEDPVVRLLSNPRQAADMLGLTPKQAANVKALITGTGAGTGAAAVSKYFSKHLGSEVAGAIGGLIGGFLGGHVSKKLMK